jgi:hypothetical protein
MLMALVPLRLVSLIPLRECRVEADERSKPAPPIVQT